MRLKRHFEEISTGEILGGLRYSRAPMINQTVQTIPNSSALVPRLLSQIDGKFRNNAILIFVGVMTIGLLAQIQIPLSFTPVPITGQTLGVALIALLFGRVRAVSTVAAYLALGAVGAPLFATTTTGAGFGPTAGYLIGMLLAAFVMGHLADRGWTRSFRKAWLATFLGSVITFTFGLAALSFFIPKSALLAWGFYPFVPGDIAKTLIAALIVSQVSKAASKVANGNLPTQTA